MEQIVKITAKEVVAAYTKIGASEKKMTQLAFESEETPLKGLIIAFDDVPKEYNGNKYFTFKVERPDGTIGSLSVSRLNDTFVKEGEFIVIKSKPNEGNVMLKSFRASGDVVRNIGRSDAERIANMVGKSYTAERIAGYVLDSYEPKNIFVMPKVEGAPSKTELSQLWDNTVASDRIFKFLTIE